ncbi:hypothetical protein [Hirschia litorea]|uniref:Phage ABA sandwich domain-containing protein n=1 Tax=Hirschia litorea TaxID=1199156 RepID=A0ABW2IIN6_9PROT
MPPTEMPLKDGDGRIIPHDHPEIADCQNVIRRVPEQWKVQRADGTYRLSSMAFKSSTDEMSVDLEWWLKEDGIDPESFVITPRWIAAILWRVQEVRDLDFKVGYDPIAGGSNENVYHGEVWGRSSKSKQNALCNLSVWLVKMPDVDLALK